MKEDNGDLRQYLFDDMANMEGTKVLVERIDTPEFTYLVRHRPLPPEWERRKGEYEKNLRDFEDKLIVLETEMRQMKIEGDNRIHVR